jgi:hypothetical protein
MDRYSDPIMQELIKDICLQRGLRHDIYVRGARRGGIQHWETAISGLTLVPLVGPDELQTTLDVPGGKAEMSEPLKEVMGAALQRPATVGELLARAPGCSSAPELASVMIGSDQWQPSMWPQSGQPEGADRLNRLLGGRVPSVVDGRGLALACGKLGTGLVVSPLLQFIAGRLLNGESEKDADAWVAALSGDVHPEQLDTLRKVMHAALEQRVPLLRQLHIVPG